MPHVYPAKNREAIWPRLQVHSAGNSGTFQKSRKLTETWSYRSGKRAFDLLLALVLLPLFAPVLLLLVSILRMSGKGPVFFRQRRIGQHGRPFFLYKFRTMLPGSELLLTDYLATAPEARQEWERSQKLQRDPRVTRLGAVLRRTSLDELPQLFNVLAGHMSFVGPRPVLEEELKRYGPALPFYLAAKPGITGLWQTSGRCTLSYEARVSLDVQYMQSWSLLGDVRLVAKTAGAVWRCEGSC